MSIAFRWMKILAGDALSGLVVGGAFVVIPALIGAWNRFGQATPPAAGTTIKETVIARTEQVEQEVGALRHDMHESFSAVSKQLKELTRLVQEPKANAEQPTA